MKIQACRDMVKGKAARINPYRVTSAARTFAMALM
jgi:hypothetical protein